MYSPCIKFLVLKVHMWFFLIFLSQCLRHQTMNKRPSHLASETLLLSVFHLSFLTLPLLFLFLACSLRMFFLWCHIVFLRSSLFSLLWTLITSSNYLYGINIQNMFLKSWLLSHISDVYLSGEPRLNIAKKTLFLKSTLSSFFNC